MMDMKPDNSSEHLEDLILSLAEAGLTIWNELNAEYLEKSRSVDWGEVNEALMLLEQTRSKFSS